MDSLLRDLKFFVRSLLKHPGFAAVAVLTLALGIAANATIFSSVDALIIHPFSFPNQQRLLVFWEWNWAVGTLRGSVAPGNFTDWRNRIKHVNNWCGQISTIPTGEAVVSRNAARRAAKVDPLVALRDE